MPGDALMQLRAVNQLMDLMDAYDEEEAEIRAQRRRRIWVSKWLLIRDNPRYITIKLYQKCDGNVNLSKKLQLHHPI